MTLKIKALHALRKQRSIPFNRGDILILLNIFFNDLYINEFPDTLLNHGRNLSRETEIYSKTLEIYVELKSDHCVCCFYSASHFYSYLYIEENWR